MEKSTFFWFLITFFCIVAQGFYSMLELAAVSFNKVRLQYYLSKGLKRAVWLKYLLEKPSRLFGTVMLGVNIALQIGSQGSREFYQSIGLDPDLAPITQVFLVVILGELAPLFAARRYAEHVVMLGIPIVYATERLLAPIVWFIGLLSTYLTKFLKMPSENIDILLTREELQKVLETQEENLGEKEEFNVIVSNIFALRSKIARQVMVPINKLEMVDSETTISGLKTKVTWNKSYIPIYHKRKTNIVAMAFVGDLVKGLSYRQVREYARPPWFITQDTHLIPILTQFKKNNQKIAVVLNPQGLAIGIVTLESIIKEILGTGSENLNESLQAPIIERSFPGNMKIEDFNREYGTNLAYQDAETFAQLLFMQLGHHPEKGESIIIDRFEITAIETFLIGTKTISIKSLEPYG